MFRNSYLETYKHAVLNNKQVDYLLVHLSQIYATIGSVISDLEYQFGLILAQTQVKYIQKSQRNSIKSPPYIFNPAKQPSPELHQQNDFDEIQNKLTNYANVQRKPLPAVNVQATHPMFEKIFEKEARKKSVDVTYEMNEKQKQKNPSPYNPVIESTQDFEALFLNPKDEIVNANSNSRAVPPRVSNKTKQSAGNHQRGNKMSENSDIDFMDKLFRN